MLNVALNQIYYLCAIQLHYSMFKKSCFLHILPFTAFEITLEYLTTEFQFSTDPAPKKLQLVRESFSSFLFQVRPNVLVSGTGKSILVKLFFNPRDSLRHIKGSKWATGCFPLHCSIFILFPGNIIMALDVRSVCAKRPAATNKPQYKMLLLLAISTQ